MFSESCYHKWTFIAFKTNNQCFGHIHDIVCPNMPKLGTCVHCGMPSNVAEQRFWHVSQKKPNFIFQVIKTTFFVKRLPTVPSKIAPTHYCPKVDIILWKITKMHAFLSSLPIFFHLNYFVSIQQETAKFWTTTTT